MRGGFLSITKTDSPISFPKTKQELFEKIADEHPWALEEFCDVLDSEGRARIPFRFNQAQRRYVAEVWKPGVRRVVVGKSRKWGFSTLALGLGLMRTLTTPGWTYRIVAHKQDTAAQLNKTIKLLYESLWKSLKEVTGDPGYFIPKPSRDHVYGYDFESIKSAVIVDTASGKGVGQSDRNDELYLTEYSDWERAEDAFAGLEGSQPAGSKTSRIIIDFNAHGTDNDAYFKYTRAKNQEAPDWNGFTAFFAGVLDCPEWYSATFLEEKRRSLGRSFPAVYPSNDEEMFLANERAVWDHETLSDAHELGKQLGYQPDAEYIIHSVDTAEGAFEGDAQICTSWGRLDNGIWIETMPPIHGHWPEDIFANMVAERCFEHPGVCIVERNVGSTVIKTLRDKDVPHIYRHKHMDKSGKQYLEYGFHTTGPSKKIMIAETGRMLREGELAIVTPKLYEQAKEYEWKVKDEGVVQAGIEIMTEIAGSPRRFNSQTGGEHGDLVMGMMLMTQAIGSVSSGDYGY